MMMAVNLEPAFEVVVAFGLNRQAMFDGRQQLAFTLAKCLVRDDDFGEHRRLVHEPAGLHAVRLEQLEGGAKGALAPEASSVGRNSSVRDMRVLVEQQNLV